MARNARDHGDRPANVRHPGLLDVNASRALAVQSRLATVRLQAAVGATKDRLLASQQRLESSWRLLQEGADARTQGALGNRIQTLTTSLEELHLRLVVELASTSDDLDLLLSVADEVHSLADFSALATEASLSDSEAERAGQLS